MTPEQKKVVDTARQVWIQAMFEILDQSNQEATTLEILRETEQLLVDMGDVLEQTDAELPLWSTRDFERRYEQDG